MSRTLWPMLAAVFLTACAQPTPEQQIVNNAAEALGGRDRILAAKTLVLEGQGINGNLGQDMTPDATGQAFTVSATGARWTWPADASASSRHARPISSSSRARRPRSRCRASTAMWRTMSRQMAPRHGRRTQSPEIVERSSTTTR